MSQSVTRLNLNLGLKFSSEYICLHLLCSLRKVNFGRKEEEMMEECLWKQTQKNEDTLILVKNKRETWWSKQNGYHGNVKKWNKLQIWTIPRLKHDVKISFESNKLKQNKTKSQKMHIETPYGTKMEDLWTMH